MKVLVTGANGHIGANVVRALIKQGHAVRGFVRQASDTQGIDGLDIDSAGNVRDFSLHQQLPALH